MLGKKEGNVDSDIIFSAMKRLYLKKFGKVVLVSGDGDCKSLSSTYFVYLKVEFSKKQKREASLGNEPFGALLIIIAISNQGIVQSKVPTQPERHSLSPHSS